MKLGCLELNSELAGDDTYVNNESFVDEHNIHWCESSWVSYETVGHELKLKVHNKVKLHFFFSLALSITVVELTLVLKEME